MQKSSYIIHHFSILIMEKFLRKIFKFLLFLSFVLLLIGLFNCFFYIKNKPVLHKKTVLAMGDSHILKSFNKDLFVNAVNMAQTAEPYVFTYWKLKKTIDGIQPDSLFLGFSPHNISMTQYFKLSKYQNTLATSLIKRMYIFFDFNSFYNSKELDKKNFIITVFKGFFYISTC